MAEGEGFERIGGQSEGTVGDSDRSMSNVPSDVRTPAEMRGAALQIAADRGGECSPGATEVDGGGGRTGSATTRFAKARRPTVVLAQGLREKADEFRKGGGEIYRKA